MNRHPLDVERLIGWLSFALGASALQGNDSTFYRIAENTMPWIWILSYCVIGGALVLSTYKAIPRCRIVLLMMLLIIWCGGLGLVIASGPLGAYGAAAIVMILTILQILWTKVSADDREFG